MTFIAAAVPLVSSHKIFVNLRYAQVQGGFNSISNVTSFLGIRYAAPPTGSLRWQPPHAPATVSGIQHANRQPQQCSQGSAGMASTTLFTGNYVPRKRDVVPTEDCLFLNVFVSGHVAPNAKLPVVVWIHGVGYDFGNATGDGGDFIRDANGGVILVIIQYRLGVFGFLSGAEIKTNGVLNAGLLDQNFALQWVQDHVLIPGS